MASVRLGIANRFAILIIERNMTSPYGGNISLETASNGGKYYSVAFARPRTLDGEIRVWSEKNIIIRTSRGDWNCTSEAEAVQMLKTL